jgi:hypothetical protein
MVDPAGKDGDELEFEDTFDGDSLDLTRWLPRHAGEQRVNGIKVGCPPAEDQARTVLD